MWRPIGWGRWNPPHVSGFVKSNSYQPERTISAHGNAIGNTSGHAVTAGKFTDTNRGPWLQRSAGAQSATLRIDHDCLAVLLRGRIQGGEQHVDLQPNPSAASG